MARADKIRAESEMWVSPHLRLFLPFSAHNGSSRPFDLCEYEPFALFLGWRNGDWPVFGLLRVNDRDGLPRPSSRSLSEYTGISRNADSGMKGRILGLNTLWTWCFCTRPRMI